MTTICRVPEKEPTEKDPTKKDATQDVWSLRYAIDVQKRASPTSDASKPLRTVQSQRGEPGTDGPVLGLLP